MLILLWMAPAHAGCGVDEGQDARQHAAPLIVTGTVIGLRMDERTVVERVRVDHTYKGAVESGVIELTTSLPSHGCASSWVVPVGTQVRVIGAPDDAGRVPLSVCTNDVSRRVDPAELQVIAAARPETAASFAGAPAVDPALVLPALEPTGDLLVSAWLSEQWRVGHQVGRGPDGVTAVWQVGGVRVQGTVAPEALRPVLAAPWSVHGLVVAPGTPVRQGTLDLPPGITWTTPVPKAAVSDAWTPAAPAPVPAGAPVTSEGTVRLFDAPDGTLLVVLEPSTRVTLTELQDVDGWTQVYVDHAGISGTAWTPSEAVSWGLWGVGSGGGVGSTVVLVDLEPGMALRALGTDTVVAQVTEPMRVPWLYKQDDTIVVALETPWGTAVTETACAHCVW